MQKFIHDNGIRGYNEKTGEIRHILVRVGNKTGKEMITL